MDRPAMPNKKGLTLIEVLVALVITLVLFLALMQSALLSMSINTGSTLRNEAIAIADMRMRDVRNEIYSALADDTDSLSGANCPSGFSSTGVLVTRDIRNIIGFDFCTNMTVNPLGTANKQVIITVGWVWQNEPYTHTVSTVVGEQ